MKQYLNSFFNKASCNLCLAGIVSLLTILVGCASDQEIDHGKALVAYGDQVLYQHEVSYFLPDSLSKSDSVRLARQFIDEWVRGQVVREAANQAVDDLEEKVAYLREAYERSVVEHSYVEDLLARNEAGLAVSEEEIQAYYEENPNKFLSRAYYFQYFYVETQLEGQYKVVNLIRSDDPDKIEELKVWCQENATEFKLDSSFVDEVEIDRIAEGFYYGNIKRASKRTAYTYMHDEKGTAHYDFFRLLEVIEPGDLLPLSISRERIEQILRTQRKQSLVQKHINGLVKQAQAAQKVTFYP